MTWSPLSGSAAPRRQRIRSAVVYALLIGSTFLGFQIVQWRGTALQAPEPSSAARFGVTAAGAQIEALLHVLLALASVIVFARIVGTLFRFIHQPPVIGEVIAGILLGPSFLGQIFPAASHYILPPSVAPYLSIIAQVGILLYMFLVGLEFDPASIKNRAHSAIVISHASIMAPFLLGSGLALALYPRVSTADVPFPIFALFMGVSMSITAFPVLARILTDRAIHKTPLGAMALTCAAVDDVTAWCLLSVLVSIVHTQGGGSLLTLVLTPLYVFLMIVVARPVVVRLAQRQEKRGLTRGAMTAVCVALLASSLITEYIGIHAIFGAFLLGTLIPSDSSVARHIHHKLEDLVIVLFLPAYFAFTGMRTQIGLMSGIDSWILCGFIILVASAGKVGGTFFAARFSGLQSKEALPLGILMNTRGLMELIVLNIGMDLRIISPILFAMMVLMALATTLATAPAMHFLVLRKTAGAVPRPPGD
jgi:Kef-type K+ transport system membrane component KefB